jgi:hypothetical protein
MTPDLDPIDLGDTIFEPDTSTTRRSKRCSPEVRMFMSRALRELVDKPIDTSIEVPLESFKRVGLEPNSFQVMHILEGCPESDYIKVEPIDDKIKLTIIDKPDTRAVKWYKPRFREDETEVEND